MSNPTRPSQTTTSEHQLKPALHHDDQSNALPSSQKKSERHILWDEDTIEKHDEERGTRMKIEEPKTPFTHLKDDSSDGGSVGASSPSHDIANQWEDLTSKLDSLSSEQQKRLERTGSVGSYLTADEEEERKKKHEAFLRHRQDHYNEFEQMKRFRASHPDDEDEDESDTENCAKD